MISGDDADQDTVIITSTNLTSWTVRPVSGYSYIGSIAFGNGLFVISAYNGSTNILTSPDGITWTNRFNPSSNDVTIMYVNGLFVMENGTSIYTSPNGINWTLQFTVDDYIQDICAGIIFLISCNDGTFYTSANGINWKKHNSISPNILITRLAYGNGIYLGFDYKGGYFYTYQTYTDIGKYEPTVNRYDFTDNTHLILTS
jgi:hypothetical protein